MRGIKVVITSVLLAVAHNPSWAGNLSDITNYRAYSTVFSSSGQPTAEQLQLAADQGFRRIIYIAFSDNDTAIANEDRVVKSLGMDFVQIPVDWDNPTVHDFEDFAALLNRDKQVRTLLHCQVNFRASAFSFLYRVIYAGVPIAEAKADLDAIWQPNETWYRFIVDVLEQHRMSHQCETCDWGANEFSR